MSVPAFFAIRCAPCYGTGSQEQDTPCPICKGEGLIPLPGKAEDYTDCQGCGGSGFSGFNNQTICVRCEGIGAVKKKTKSGKRLSRSDGIYRP